MLEKKVWKINIKMLTCPLGNSPNDNWVYSSSVKDISLSQWLIVWFWLTQLPPQNASIMPTCEWKHACPCYINLGLMKRIRFGLMGNIIRIQSMKNTDITLSREYQHTSLNLSSILPIQMLPEMEPDYSEIPEEKSTIPPPPSTPTSEASSNVLTRRFRFIKRLSQDV